MIENPSIDPADELVCLGHLEDLDEHGGAMSPPIVQTSLFAHRSTDDLTAGLGVEHQSHVYTLGQNPTVESLETKLARLERGEACKVLASVNLSRSLEDSVTIVEPLMPWTVSGIFMSSTLEVPTLELLPWAVFCYCGPILSLLWAAGFDRTGCGLRRLADQ